MSTCTTPTITIRRAQAADAGLIGYLRFASLLCLEMSQRSLQAVRSLMASLPDVDTRLVSAGSYYVAESAGELVAGAGWSVLPLSFRGDALVDERGDPAPLRLGHSSALVRGFFVDPDLCRCRAGAELLARVEAELFEAGHLGAELIVPLAAEIAYRRLGYRPVRRLGLDVGGGETLPLLQLRKQLSLRLAAAA